MAVVAIASILVSTAERNEGGAEEDGRQAQRAGGQIPVLCVTLLMLVANSNYATLNSIVWELVFIRLSCAG